MRDDVAEQREDNNVVRLAIALQDADVFVAPLFFSPNGDGVQDAFADDPLHQGLARTNHFRGQDELRVFGEARRQPFFR